jgi:hypothetical protein
LKKIEEARAKRAERCEVIADWVVDVLQDVLASLVEALGPQVLVAKCVTVDNQVADPGLSIRRGPERTPHSSPPPSSDRR